MDLREHYRDLYKEHGDSPAANQWRDLATQEKRFQILTEIAPLTGEALLDFGCGTAHLVTYLKQRGIAVASYTGIDIVEEALACGRQKHPQHQFFLPEEGLQQQYDYVLISGVFNNLLPDNRAYYREWLHKIFSVARKGVAFNMLSHYVDYYDAGLFYEKPEDVIAFIKQELSPYVVLRSEYQIKEGVIPFEFTVYVYKK